ncbi:MAG TPA: hypothetical protein VK427_03765 [Kofleriaceae bacterium]|nr:hypothetical protein [Kofleriaceae bacterium]
MRAALVRSAWAALALAACGDGGETPIDAPAALPDTPPREVIMENVSLVVTEIAEGVLVGGPGDYARITIAAPAPALDWNIHGHANGGTQVVAEELKVMTVDYVFQPAARADWYLLLRNRGQQDMTLQLQIELYGNMTWSGWQ